MAHIKGYRSILISAAALLPALVSAAVDPCTLIGGKAFVPPADVLACITSFPFNETLRQNVLNNVARVFDFYTFENYYLNSPYPFQESTIDIRAALARINTTTYTTDYAFNKDLFDFTTQLNDGHTRWFPNCYNSYQNILPAPVITIEENGAQGVYVAFDSVEFLSQLGANFTGYFDSINFDWKRLAGAHVLAINGQDPYTYVDYIASTVSGNYLDHGVRVNSVFSSYRISPNVLSQRVGDLAGPIFISQTSLTMTLVPVNSTQPETVTIPFLAALIGASFTDSASYWANNCAANSATNGVDLKQGSSTSRLTVQARKLAKAVIIDKSTSNAVALPPQYVPTLPKVPGGSGVVQSFMLDSQTAVMFVGSFSDDFNGFQAYVASSLMTLKAQGATRLLIDLTNNGGGYVCLGQFLHQYLAGSAIGYPGFQSTVRANTLAQKIVAADIAYGLNNQYSYYTADNFAYLNDTQMSPNVNYINPDLPFYINQVYDPTSQRFHDTCGLTFTQPIPASPPFDLSNVAIVSNGDCASTCAMFSTLMYERHNTKIAVFGGKPGENVEYKGMAGNQVLEWADLDTEIKTAGLKSDPLAPPDLLVSGNFRHNWRTAWSYFDEELPIAYLSELSIYRFPYTKETYNNPQNLWTFAAAQLFI